MFMQPFRPLTVSVVVGGGESDEYRRQSRSLSDCWRGAAGTISYFETSGHDHFRIIEAMTEPHDPLASILLRHMGL